MSWLRYHINPNNYPRHTFLGWAALIVLIICIVALNACTTPGDFKKDQLEWLNKNLH